MATFAQLSEQVTRRGYLSTVEHGQETWLVTGQDDVIATDVRSGFSAFINPEDLTSLVNQSALLTEALRVLVDMAHPTQEDVQDILKDFI